MPTRPFSGRRPGMLSLGCAVLIFALGACSLSLGASAPFQRTASGSISTGSAAPGGPGASHTSTSSSPATPDPTKPAALRKAIAEGAYSNAGGPIPDGATKITAVGSDGTALIRTPTGNIGCEFSATAYAGCGVSSYMSDVPYGKDEAGPAWWIDLSAANAIPRIVSHSQPGSWEVGSHTVQTVPYGSVVHYGSYVCASESPGLTCWNTANGHGAFMRRSSTTVF